MLTSVSMLLRRRGLLVLPLVSGVTVVFLVLCAGGGGAALIASGVPVDRAFIEWMILPAFLVYLGCWFVAIFLNAALVACFLLGMEGKPAGLSDGLRLAWARRSLILRWALLYSSIGAILSVISSRARSLRGRTGLLTGLLTWAPSAAWSLATFLIVPVIVFEELPTARECLKRSFELFRRTWGEQVAGRLGAGLAVALVAAACIGVVGAVGYGLSSTALAGHAIALSLAVLAVVMVLGAAAILVCGALNAVYSSVLYAYAVTGMLPDEFSPDLLPQPKEG